jgi:aspartyl-tRNA(Asn)/glutamyl-tRNA(Gln) amidotransferase subunit A
MRTRIAPTAAITIYMPGDLTTIPDLARSLQDGESPSALIDLLLARAAECNGRDRFYTQVLPAKARARARTVEAWISGEVAGRLRPALLGVPVVIKDNIEILGEPTSCGSVAFARPPAPRDAAIVRRLENAGAVIIGKTNLDEAALGASGRNAHFGRCVNPRGAQLLSGGSSSGSAAAVAAGHALIGIGTDTLGSVRIPAALCGLVGFKPTHGRIPTDGVVPLHVDFDTVGFLSRSLEDAAFTATALLDFATMTGAPRDDVLRLWVLPDSALEETRDVRADDYRRLIDSLSKSAEVSLRECPRFDYMAVARAALWEVASRFAFNSDLGTDSGASLGDELRQVLRRAREMPDGKLRDGRTLLAAAAALMRTLLADADGILTPTCPVDAIDLREPLPKSISAYVAPANVAGLPAVSWPQPLDSQRTLNLQIIGRAGRDADLLNHAARVRRVAMRRGY